MEHRYEWANLQCTAKKNQHTMTVVHGGRNSGGPYISCLNHFGRGVTQAKHSKTIAFFNHNDTLIESQEGQSGIDETVLLIIMSTCQHRREGF